MNYTGALHIHSTFSDGSGSIEDIIKAAKKAGLSWIIITDHNNLSGINDEGWHDGIAVLVSEEISPAENNHYLALNINKEISRELMPADFINEVKEQGGMGFIAHPDENPLRKNGIKPLRWGNWDIKGFDGIEIWNSLSDWVDNYDKKKPLYCYLKRNDILTGPTPKVLKWWDDLNNKNPKIIPAVGGVDAHALIYKFMGIKVKIFPYYDSFKTVINRLHLDGKLSKDFGQAKVQIYNALKEGKSTIINKAWNNKSNENNDFNFYAKNKNHHKYPGSSINLDNNTGLFINTSKKAKLRLIYNGKIIQENTGCELVYKNPEPGKYRAEAYYKDKPWVFTNPILVI